MTGDDLKQLVTLKDLKELQNNLLNEFKEMLINTNIKEMYTPKEFSKLTGMKYTTVIHYCKSGKIMARQEAKGGSWTINREEVDKIIDEAKDNVLYA